MLFRYFKIYTYFNLSLMVLILCKFKMNMMTFEVFFTYSLSDVIKFLNNNWNKSNLSVHVKCNFNFKYNVL